MAAQSPPRQRLMGRGRPPPAAARGVRGPAAGGAPPVAADRARWRGCRSSPRGEAGEGPVDGEGDQVGEELLGAGRQAADQQAGGVGEAPEQAEPAGAVVECIIEVEQQRRAGFEQVGAGADGGGGIGHVVEHTEAVAEILGVGRQAAGGHGGLVELHVGLISEGAYGHGQGAGRIDAVQPAHTGGHEAGPAT